MPLVSTSSRAIETESDLNPFGTGSVRILPRAHVHDDYVVARAKIPFDPSLDPSGLGRGPLSRCFEPGTPSQTTRMFSEAECGRVFDLSRLSHSHLEINKSRRPHTNL